jgi:hypothetical protein
MTDIDNTDNENIDTDLGSYSVDDEDQPTGPDSLVDSDRLDDPMDEGYSPPERPLGVNAFGTTATEQHQGESLEQRIAQEEPDPAAAFDDPLAEPDTVGGDDPDAISADQDFLGDPEVGGDRAGRLVAPDEGSHEDAEKDLVAGDVGIDGGAASAEEAAMHVVDEP